MCFQTFTFLYLDNDECCNPETTRYFRDNWRRHTGGQGWCTCVISPESLRHRSRYTTHRTPNCPNHRQLHRVKQND